MSAPAVHGEQINDAVFIDPNKDKRRKIYCPIYLFFYILKYFFLNCCHRNSSLEYCV